MANTPLSKELEESCSNVAHLNFDGHVRVREHTPGVLTFTFVDEDGDESSLTAHFVGTFKDHAIYSFCASEDTVETGVHMTLVPVAIVGLMTL